MIPTLVLAFTAFALCFLLTPLVRCVAISCGVVDAPDQYRKHQTVPVPRLGGVAVALSYALSFGVLWLSPFPERALLTANPYGVALLFAAASLIFGIGVLDDCCNLRPRTKLVGQLVAAGIAYAAGVRVLGIGGYEAEAWWGLPVTILWLVGCTNAFNLIDGLDGLAAGLGLFASLTMLAAALLHQNVGLAIAIVPLTGCLIGFLLFNFNPASIYLGDSGSLLIGFLLGCYGVIWTHKSSTLIGLMAPMMAVAIPLLDTTLAILRRFLLSRPLFTADRGHIHHRLLDRGFSTRRVAFMLYGCAILAALLSLLQQAVHKQYEGLILAVFCCAVITGVNYLGILEFDVFRRMILRGSFRRLVDGQIRLENLRRNLATARPIQKRWFLIRDGARDLGFAYLRLEWEDQIWEERLSDDQAPDCWTVQIPLDGIGCITLQHHRSYIGLNMLGPFIDVVCRELLASARRPRLTQRAAAVFSAEATR